MLIYKEGRLHSNVDVLSRPVLYTELIYTMELAKKDDFSFEKGLDVFENEVYMFSYKEKKFIKINQDSYEQLYQEANEGGA